MPTLEHNGLVEMFRGEPGLAPHLVESLFHMPMPRYDTVAVVESTLDQLLPTEFRADLVLELKETTGALVLSIVLEVQRDDDDDKKFTWPVYHAVRRSRSRCPAIVLVVAPDAKVSAWAAEPIDLGLGLSSVRPLVLGPGVVPEVTDPASAKEQPELALLSAVAHGNGPNGLAVLRTALAVLTALDQPMGGVYFRIIHNVLRGPMREALEKLIMEQRNLMSDDDLPPFLRQFVDRGMVEGKLEGKRDTLRHLLGHLGVAPTAEQGRRIEECKDIAVLQRWIDNLFGGKTGADLFD